MHADSSLAKIHIAQPLDPKFTGRSVKFVNFRLQSMPFEQIDMIRSHRPSSTPKFRAFGDGQAGD